MPSGEKGKPAMPVLPDVKPGDYVRVKGWPGTAGKRFKVKAVEPYEGPSVSQRDDTETVHAWEVERGGTRGKLRSFPLSCVAPDRTYENHKRGGEMTVTKNPEALKRYRRRSA